MGLFRREKRTLTGSTTVGVRGTSMRQRVIPGTGRSLFELRRDPGNASDPNAVMVLAGRAHVGFLPAEDARVFSALIKRNDSARVRTFAPGEVLDGETGRWILLMLPSVDEVQGWLKGS